VTEAGFRKLALGFEGVEERSHMRHPDFRVGNRIFATLSYPREGWAMIILTPEEQREFTAASPDAFVPVKGKWGEQGCTNVILAHAQAGDVRAALTLAYEVRLALGPASKRRRK
jgi:hypothetical protein